MAVVLAIALAALLLGGAMQATGLGIDHGAVQPVVIRRVMSANPSACYPVNGQYYDWLELENRGDDAVNLRGWMLADRIDLRGAYVFGDVTLPAGGTQLVYCASQPKDAPEDAIFTGFKLSSDGELLLLADPKERIAFSLAMPAIKAGWVYRRDDASDGWIAEPMDDGGDDPGERAVFDSGGLRVNEIMPSNHSTLLDGDGDSSDWIELYNGESTPVNLAGYALAGKGGKAARWRFPEVTIGSGEYLVVFASGKDRTEGGELHTGFRLSAASASVRLYDPDGEEISRLSCKEMAADASASRTDAGDVTTAWAPTPGYRNSENGLPDALPELTRNDLGIYINELCNVAGGDWVELVNTGTSDLDLGGMGLSDDLARPRKWQFDPGTRIPAGGYLLVSLSGNGKEAKGPVANFAVSNGETLCLATPEGRVIDAVRVFPQPAGVSYGRAQGEARYRYFGQPTPGAANGGSSYSGQCGKVRFSLPGGVHSETSLTVTLEGEGGAAIYYTTDGTAPTASSQRYTAPLQITENTVVRAIAHREGMLPSAEGAASYILGESHPNMYVVCVSGDRAALIGEGGVLNTGMKRDKPDVFVEIYDPGGTLLVGQACNFMISGHSSREENAQKAFRLKARSEYGDNRFRAKLFTRRDAEEFKAVTLRASGQDCNRTHMLDSVLTALAADTTVMYMETELAVVYVDGQYWGVYNLRERVTPQDIANAEGWSNPDDVVLLSNGNSEQGGGGAYRNLMNWVSQTDFSDEANLKQLRQYVDVENYLDYVALEIYTSNLDLGNVRCYSNPAEGGRWKWILFDLDLSFQVDRNTPKDWMTPGGVGSITSQDNTLFIKLMENAGVRQYFLTRCGELLRTTFSAENVVSRIQARYELLKPEMEQNCARWGWSTDAWVKYGKRIVKYARTRPQKLVGYFKIAFDLSDAEVQTYFGGVE